MSGTGVCALLSVALLSAVIAERPTRWPQTTGSPRNNLAGKMMTLSAYEGGVTFYPPYYSPPKASRRNYPWATRSPYPWATRSPYPWATRSPYPWATRSPYPWTTRSPYPWTTRSPTAGISVCLRFITAGGGSIFQLNPGSYEALRLAQVPQSDSVRRFALSRNSPYLEYVLTPNLQIWPNIYPEIWNRLCLVLDSVKSVVQLYSGSYMSARKLVAPPMTWSGRPVIGVTDFDGQVTDLQMWDYPIGPNMVYNYMTSRSFGLATGNVLTWSNIAYSASGRILTEECYLYTLAEEAGQHGSRHRHKAKKTFVSVKGGRMRNQM